MIIADDHSTRKSISAIKSSSEAKRVINELLTTRKSNVARAKDGCDEVRRSLGPRDGESAVQDPTPQGPTTNRISGTADIAVANTVRHIAGRLLTREVPRRSKSETHLEQPLPELDASQKCVSMTRLVTLSPKIVRSRGAATTYDNQHTYAMRVAVGNELTDGKNPSSPKSPGFYSRKLQQNQQHRQQLQNFARQNQQQNSPPPSHKSGKVRQKAKQDSSLTFSGKRKKPQSSTNAGRFRDKDEFKFSPASERRHKTGEPSTRLGIAAGEAAKDPPRAKPPRERSFDMTFPGYDVRYDVRLDPKIELPQLTDVEKEIEEEFRKKSVDKCRRWMNRWMPVD
ncbi:uncharacterized protein [Diadema antillarum]|uniref:uncharacterized protein n=1 Tax=Diadema antillarum TaxID=105358 RepID=UPI003A886789